MALHPLHAVDLIIDLVKKNPGEITILCTGPMSNLARAIVKEPEIKPLIAGVIAISGAFGLNKYSFLNATGDTPQSEWNVYVDPEAAELVYNSGIPLVALGLDVATHFDVNFSSDDLRLFTESGRKEANFLAQAIRFVNGRGFEAYCIHHRLHGGRLCHRPDVGGDEEVPLRRGNRWYSDTRHDCA